MKITLETHGVVLSGHYIETLVLLYKPCEKFGKDAKDSDTLSAYFEEKDGILSGRMIFVSNRKEYTEEAREEASHYPDFCDRIKSFSGKLFIKLFSGIFGYIPPWGMMTGVRPAQFALGIYEKTGSYEKTAEILEKLYLVSPEKARLACDISLVDQSVKNGLSENSCGLYIGIPFCPTRCRYCSFVSYATERLISLLPEYVDKLIEDIAQTKELMNEYSFTPDMIYVGGGTPSILDEKLLTRLLSAIEKNIGTERISEFSFEAGRPDTVTREKLMLLHDFGVNRVCINTQTSNDGILEKIGRRHTFSDWERAYCMARDTGFSSVNCDLIAGLPDESRESFQKSMTDVLAYSPDNITVHSFSLKRSSELTTSGNRFESKRNDEVLSMINDAEEMLCNAGYSPYYIYRQKNTAGNSENVGFGRDNKLCYYNVCMMEELKPIFSVGAGSSTKLVGKNSETANFYRPKYPYEYLSDNGYIHKQRELVKKFYGANQEKQV